MLLVVGGKARGRESSGFEVKRGIGKDERLAGEVVEVRLLERLRVRDGIAGLVGSIVAGGRDQQEAMLRIGGIRLQPALGDVAGMLMVGITTAIVRDESGGDGGVAVEDAKVNFGLGNVSADTSGGAENGRVMLWLTQRSIGVKEARNVGGRIAETGGIDCGGDAMPLFVFRNEYGTDKMLIELDSEDGIEFVRGA